MHRLSLTLLGSFEARLNGQPITAFESNKARALLAYLAVEAGQAHRREALAGLLWPEQIESAARHNLRQSLTRLRRAIADDEASPSHLLLTRETVQFNLASDHRLDVADFAALVTACREHPHRRLETCKLCLQRLAQAAELYAGEFLHQFYVSDSTPFEEWALVQREWLSRENLRALRVLAEYYEQRENYELGLRYASRQVELDPLREEAHRQLMRLLALDGQARAALAQYESCRRLLAEELDAAPSEETTALYRRILTGQSPRMARGLPGSAWPYNLPAQLTPFVGREEELAQIVEHLEDPAYRLLTFLGPGGCGKTRLALEAADRAVELFRHGTYFVPLESVSSAEFLAPAITDALELSLEGHEEPRAALLRHLKEKEILLVLDDFEQRLNGIDLILDLLRNAPGVKLIVTSQTRLNLQAEDVFRIEGLRFPADERAPDAADYDAAQLFLERARRVRKDFALTPETTPSVARICRLLEGEPLGLELAAARVEERSCEAIAAEIRQSLDALATTLLDLPPRQRSLRAAFEHSWRNLSAREQEAAGRLSVFEGGFRAGAAERVAGADARTLRALADKSFLRELPSARYRMHETLRQFAQAKLAAVDGESQRTRDRHCRYYADLFAEKRETLAKSPQVEAVDEIADEIDNARAAWRWAVQNNKEDEIRKLLDSLFRFYDPRGWPLQPELPARMVTAQPPLPGD